MVVSLVAAVLLVAACQPPVLAPPPTLGAVGSCGTGAGLPPCCPSSAAGVSWYGNLRYGHDVDQNEDLYLDAYLPSGAGSTTPAVVLVHGGGHVGGDKCDGASAAGKMAAAGVAVFTIEYPLATPTSPTSADTAPDARLAVTWVRANAGSFNVDPTRLGLWGTSAGVDVAYTAAYSATHTDPGASVKAVAGWSGVYDFVDEYYRDPSNTQHVDAGTEYLGCTDLTDAGCFAQAQYASPMSFVAHDSPASLVVTSRNTGAGCESVEPQNSVQMVDALKAKGAPVTFLTTNFCGHALAYGGGQVDAPVSGTVIANTIAFFQKELGANPSPRTTPAPLPPRLVGPSVVTATSTCAPAAGSGITYDANVVYGTDFGNKLYADAYRPAAGGSGLPAVVLVHGGGHISGDKCAQSATAQRLVGDGYVVFSVNYPLATAAQPTFPNPVYDVMDSIGWVKANAAQYGVDPARIALWGGSAGGNLALSAALAAPLTQPGSTVQAVVNYSGTTDVFALAGEYAAAGSSTDPDATSWAKYLGCTAPVSLVWDTAANSCFTRYMQASPAFLLDPLGGTLPAGPAVLSATSTAFTGDGTCEIVPPRQAELVQLRGAFEGLVTQQLTTDQCAHAFAYVSTLYPPTVAFLHAHGV
ncbi:MAG: alpha/beta hydrolase fold domain-containing protein [Acidimicrobiales bacterium]